MSLEPIEEKGKIDGRKLRSSRSRDKIKASLLALIRSGNYTPRAIDISEHSGLSMRTVFRHIDDMENIAREVNADMERQLMPIVLRPYESSDWKGRLTELLAKRAHIYEIILPLRMHVSLRRYRSEFLSSEYNRLLTLEKAGLEAVLPDEIKDQHMLFIGISHATSISTWIGLRLDLGCDPKQAEEVVRLQVESLIASIE